jgi:hypothetical protein
MGPPRAAEKQDSPRVVAKGRVIRSTNGAKRKTPPSPVDGSTPYNSESDIKLGAVVPMSDCRKMYMVFVPRFENVERDLQDGCFLKAGVGT